MNMIGDRGKDINENQKMSYYKQNFNSNTINGLKG